MSKREYKFNWIYHIMRALVRFGLRIYYRRYQVVGYEKVPKDEPVFFAVNHQNAFMDALVTGTSTRGAQQPSYITRSDVFNPKTLKFLSVWKMLPIYRQRDGSDYVKKNEKMFARFVELLKMGDSILIFPEGNHGRVRKLRVLRKGIGRIVFQAMEEMDGNFDDIKIVPVGLNYSNHRNLRSDMLVIFGDSISVKDYMESHKSNDRKALIDLRNDLASAMQHLLIHIRPPEYYETIEGLRTVGSDWLLEEYPSEKKDQYNRLYAEKGMIAAVEKGLESGEINGEELKTEMEIYLKGLEDLNIRDHVVKNYPYSFGGLLLQGLGLLLTFPLFIYGYLNHALVYHVSINVARKNFKDDHFHSSVMFLLAFFLFPVAYLIQSGIVWALTDWKIALGYLVTLPFFGNFAFIFSRWFKKVRAKWTFQSLTQKKDRRAKDLLQLRQGFMAKMKAWMKTEEVSV